MPDVLSIQEPFAANNLRSHLVQEATGQTFKGNNFVQVDANGRVAAAPATPVDGSLLTGIAFAIEPGHNYAANKMENYTEVAEPSVPIEITLTGVCAQTDLVPGKGFGLSIDGATGFYVADRTKVTHTVVEFVKLAGRGLLATGKSPVGHSGDVGDTNVRIIVRIKASAGIPTASGY